MNDIFLEKIRKELSEYGIDPSQIESNGIDLQINNHLIELDLFNKKMDCALKNKISVWMYETKQIRFIYEDRDIEETPIEEDLFEKALVSATKIYNDMMNEYIQEISKKNLDKSLQDLIPAKLAKNLQITDSLKDIENWKVLVILGNSRGANSPDVTEYDNVGYTMIGAYSGTIIPIARADEHHCGFDLMHHYLEKGLIPNDSYFPIFFNHTYINANDSTGLQALKIWRKHGGKNIILNKSSGNGIPFQLTIDDYIKMEGNIIVNKGSLLPTGERFIKSLKKLAEMVSLYHQGKGQEKLIYKQAYTVVKMYKNEIEIFSKELESSLINMEAISGRESILKLEEFIFGFDGLKNKLHNKIRKELADEKKFFTDMEAVFGDLDLANYELGSM